MKNITRAFIALAIGSALGWIPSTTFASTSTWITSGSGDWNSASNWIGGSPGLSGNTNPYDTAVFGSQGGGVVTLNSSVVLGGLNFSNNTTPYTLSGSGTLNLYSPFAGVNPQVTLGGGTLTLAVALSGDQNISDGQGGNIVIPLSVDINTATNSTFIFSGSLVTAGPYSPTLNVLGSGNAIFNSPLTNAGVVCETSGSVTFSNCGIGVTGAGTGPIYLTSSNAVLGVGLDYYGDFPAANDHTTVYTLANNAISQGVDIAHTGALQIGATTQTIGSLTMEGGTIAGSGDLNLSSSITTNQFAVLSAGNISVNLNGDEGVVQEGIPGYGGFNSNTSSTYTIPGGVTTLSGHNGYAGSTTVASGTLLINGTNSGGGAILVDPAAADDGQIDTQNGIYTTPPSNTATLGGTGVTIASTVSVTNGGVISPGGIDTNGNTTIGTLSIGSLSMNNGGLSFMLGGSSNSLLSVTGDINLSGNNVISFTTNAPLTSVDYTFLTWSGTSSGVFSVTNIPAGYEFIGGTNSDMLQYVNTNWSSQTTFAGTNAVIVGGSTNFAVTVANNGITALGYSLSSGANTAGSIGSGTVSAGTTNQIGGYSFVSGTNIGVQSGSYTLTTSNASPNISVGNYTVNVYDHASGAVGASSIALSNAIVGYTGAITTNVPISNASGFRANLQTASQSTSPGLTLANISVAPGTTNNAALTFAAGQSAGVYSNSVAVTLGDNPALSGANTNLGTSTLSVTETIYNHASGSLSTNFVALPEVHVGSVTPVTSFITISNAAGLFVNLSATPTIAPSFFSIGGVSSLAQGATFTNLISYIPSQSVGTFSTVVPILLGDVSTLNGANTNLGVTNLIVTGGVYSGKASWTNTGGGNWANIGSWDVVGGTPGLSGTLSLNDTATFGALGSGNVILNTNASLSSITFSNSAASYAVTGSGTLTLQASGAINALAGNHTIATALSLATNATLTGSGSLTLSGPVSGSGAILQNGTDGLTLSGSNNFSGGTVIKSGLVIAANNNALGHGSLTINGGGLIVNAPSVTSGAVTLQSGSITGFGSLNSASYSASGGLISASLDGGILTKTGTGLLNLDGINSNLGDVISGGTLQVIGGSLGSGTVSNSSKLIFNPGQIVLSQGVISGKGSLEQTGSGTTILSAANTYSGVTYINSGTLQLGDGVHNGYLGTGSLTDKGTLALDPSGSMIEAIPINGPGGIKQIGSGTTILTGLNSYSGSTLITDGTLQIGNGGKTGNLVNRQVIDNSALAFDLSVASTVSTAITGSGAFYQIGNGTTILSGANTYSGGTVISSGTLVGTATSLHGNITDNATLVFNQPNAGVSHTSIIGSGKVLKKGAGALTLSGTNSYSGGTSITGGTVTGTTSSLQGAIVNRAKLAFNQGGSGTFTGNISGSGKLYDVGPGNVTLSGSNSLSGGTTVTLGTLLASSLGKGSLTINPGKGLTAGFTDTGTGTLSLGAITLNAGSTVSIANPYSSIDSSGRVTVSGTNNFINLSGAWTNIGTYPILTGSKISGIGLSSFDLTGSFDGDAVITPMGNTTYDGLLYTYISNPTALILTIQAVTPTPAIKGLTEDQIGGDPISVQSVPEPSTWGLVILGSLLIFLGCKRSRTLS